MTSEPIKLLTIGGSDSGGAVGVQADLRCWAVLGGYGMSVLTAVTAQNSMEVTAVRFLPPEFVAIQLDTVLSDYGAQAVKTGFVGRTALVNTITNKLREYDCGSIVIDPVLVNHRGQPMFPSDVAQAYRTQLLPLADLITPNKHEAALLAKYPLSERVSTRWLEEVATRLHDLGPKHVLVKGGRDGAESVDVLFNGRSFQYFRAPHIDTINTHGSGDTLSSAICAFLAQGDGIETAVRRAHPFTHRAIQNTARWQLGQGKGSVFPSAEE